MTGDELERAIDFLLKSQANLETQLETQAGRTDEQIRQLTVRLDSFADTQANIMIVMTRTFEAQDRINESLRAAIVELAAKQGQTEVALAKLASKVDTLADTQVIMGRTLEVLVKVVEEGRRGDG